MKMLVLHIRMIHDFLGFLGVSPACPCGTCWDDSEGTQEGGNELWICGMQAQLAPELPG